MCHVQIHRYYRSSGHTINSAMEELRGVNMEQPRTSMYVEQSIKSSVKAGVSTAFDSPMIGVMLYVTLFLMFYFESVYISKEMLLQSSYLVFVSTLLVVLMHALLVLKERNYPVCSFIPQLLLWACMCIHMMCALQFCQYTVSVYVQPDLRMHPVWNRISGIELHS